VSGKTGKSHDEVVAQYVKDAPMARLIKPEEVAAAVIYLCSVDAAAVTGTAMTIAGGEI
jgi:NAD(P)-dependent dehydrogenase (short-subunit alcohol dehydrogenase family)